MKVKINDSYFVEVKEQFYLYNSNKELLGNFMNMKQVLKSIVRYEVHQTDNKKLVLEIRNYINLLDKAEEKLNNLIDQIVIEKKLTRKELRDE
jgi:hypothetical protein